MKLIGHAGRLKRTWNGRELDSPAPEDQWRAGR
jgi:hypothetical protein